MSQRRWLVFAVTDCVQNAVHGSASYEAAACELEFIFPSSGAARHNTACFTESTCAVIKPHAIRDGRLSLYQPLNNFSALYLLLLLLEITSLTHNKLNCKDTVTNSLKLIPRLHNTTGCQASLTIGWMFVYTIQPVVRPVVQPGLTTMLNEQPLFVQPVFKPGCTTSLTTGCIV